MLTSWCKLGAGVKSAALFFSEQAQMNFKIKGWGGVILLSAAMLGGAAWYMRAAAPPATPTGATPVAPAVFEIPASATLLAVEQRLLQNLPVSGTLKAVNTVLIKSRVAGEITELKLREGDSVKAGQVVARIDPSEYQRRLRQAEQQAEAAKAQVDIAKRQYDNNKSLVDKGFISVTALETSLSSLAGAEATYKAALAGADVSRKVLDDAVLTSPISGQVSARLAQPGERVAVDGRLLELVDINSLELEATLSPADSIDVRIGQQAMLQIEGRAQAVSAKVQRINPNVQAGSRSVLVYLRLDSVGGLRQGLYGQGQLALGLHSAVAIPLDAVRNDKPEPYVQVIENNKVVHHRVKTGLRGMLPGQTDTTAWVEVSGLPAQSLILRSTAGALREGLAVHTPSSAPVTPSPAKP
jgi:RND family efflux transporter MFP subunit